MTYPEPACLTSDDGFIVVPDLHGRMQDLELLLEHYPERRYVFLGDLVDRGPDSRGVINRVRELVEAGRAHLCLGNHEWMLLAAITEVVTQGAFGPRGDLWLANGGDAVMAEYRDDFGALLLDAQWIADHACHWIIADGALCCHAHRLSAEVVEAYERGGRDTLESSADHMSELLREMPHLWTRPDEAVLPKLPKETRYSVHGHTPQKHGRPLLRRDHEGYPAYFIDLGAVFRFGYFAVFDTATEEACVFDVR